MIKDFVTFRSEDDMLGFINRTIDDKGYIIIRKLCQSCSFDIFPENSCALVYENENENISNLIHKDEVSDISLLKEIITYLMSHDILYFLHESEGLVLMCDDLEFMQHLINACRSHGSSYEKCIESIYYIENHLKLSTYGRISFSRIREIFSNM